jgi:polar amino acid transport system permease protein
MSTISNWSGFLLLLLDGAWVTLKLTVAGCGIALVGAFILGLCRLSRWAALRWFATIYIEFFRGSSIFVQLFWAYFVLPLAGFPLEPMATGILVLGLNVSAFGAEVVRGAILAVPKEQFEAAIAVNLKPYQRMRHVILPQAIIFMLPTFGNNAIELLKATAVVSLISLSDLTFQAQVIRLQTGNTAIPFVGALLIYFAISVVISRGVRRLETHLSAGLDVTKN